MTKKILLILLSISFLFLLLTINTTASETSEDFLGPLILESDANPNKVQPGDELSFSASILDIFGIKNVVAKIQHEKGFDTIDLNLKSGTNHFGTWEGSWIVHDTKIKDYNTIVTAYSKSGYKSSKIITWSDPADWWDVDWNFRKLINLNSSLVESDQNNFPVLISLTDTDLRDDAQNDGEDIAFTDISGNQLDHEIEYFNGGTGELVAWVNVTSLSSVSDTQIYMYYSNSGCSSQENSADLWSSYSMVYHLSEPSGTSGVDSVSDSTGNTGGTPSVGLSFGESGKIGNSTDFSSGTGINCGTLGSSVLTADTTISFWIYANSYSSPSRQNPFDHSYGGWGTMTIETDSDISYFFGSNGGDAHSYDSHRSDNLMANGEWIWVTAVRDDTAKTYSWYKNGAVLNSGSYDNSYPNIQNQVFTIGDGYVNPINGKMDEFRVSTVPRSANWIKTEYNNVLNANDGGFFSIGEEEIAVPTQPSLSLPVDNKKMKITKPTFEWGTSENVLNYTLLVDDEADLTDGDEWINFSFDSSTTSNTTPNSKALSEGTWYWQVVANNTNGRNYSVQRSFIVDTSSPTTPSLISPNNNNITDNNIITFNWSASSDTITEVDHYQVQIDDDPDFSSPVDLDSDSDLENNGNTTDDSTSVTITIPTGDAGVLYWRVRAWDSAENNGSYSSSRNLTIFNFQIDSDDDTVSIMKGNSQPVVLDIDVNYGELENISLDAYFPDNPSDITTSFSVSSNNESSWSSVLTITVGGDAPTESYTCIVNATSDTGIKKTKEISVDINSMTFLVLVGSDSLSLTRDDSDQSSVSVKFLTGSKQTVNLSGEWVGTSPSGVDTPIITPDTGTPSYDATITFQTTKIVSSGTYTYRVTGDGGGLTSYDDIDLIIGTDLTLTLDSDQISDGSPYCRGHRIEIDGTAKDANGNTVTSGTATVYLSSGDWSHSFTTSISNGGYSTSYLVDSNDPRGTWRIYISAEDSKENYGSTSVSEFEVETIFEILSIDIPLDKSSFDSGQKLIISGKAKNPVGEDIESGTISLYINTDNWQKILTTNITEGKFETIYYIPFDKPTGTWKISASATDQYGNTGNTWSPTLTDSDGGNKTIIIGNPDVKENYNIDIITPTTGKTYKRGEEIDFYLEITNEDGETIDGLTVTTISPHGKKIIFKKESPSGEYSANHKFRYDIPTGDYTFNIEAKKWDNGRYKTGFEQITIKIKPATINIKKIDIIDEPKKIVPGITLELKITAEYPDGTPVTKEKIIAYTPDGQKLIFKKSSDNKGEYRAFYTTTKKDVGDWTLQVNIEDAYGNAQTQSLKIEIKETPVKQKESVNPLVQYWYITVMITLIIIALASRVGIKQHRRNKLDNIKIETKQLNKLKQQKAIAYFTDGEISRDNYDKLFEEYESKLANLSKKKRILEKKLQKGGK